MVPVKKKLVLRMQVSHGRLPFTRLQILWVLSRKAKFNYLRQMKTYPNAIITIAEEICCDSLTFSCLIAAKFLASLSRFLT